MDRYCCIMRLQPLATQWHCGAERGERVLYFVARSAGKSTLYRARGGSPLDSRYTQQNKMCRIIWRIILYRIDYIVV